MRNRYLVFRLLPDEDLYEGIIRHCVENHLKAGALISAVGCVKSVCFRTAEAAGIYQEDSRFEVTGLSGTISEDGPHLHIQLCDKNLRSIGGHLRRGTLVDTTMEIVIVDLEAEYKMTRKEDPATGYDELVAEKK